MNINKALICSQSLFERMKSFIDETRGKEVSGDFRDIIVSDFVEFERKAYTLQIDPIDIPELKYAIAAFIDECVMYSEWPNRLQWMGRPLQLQFFGDHVAGENFFKKLSELRQNGQQKIDLLEIYYHCLQLGFEGMYRLKGEDQRISLISGLRAQIETARGYSDSLLSKAGLPEENFVKHVSRTVPFWIIGSVAAALILLIYLSFNIGINITSKSSLKQIESLLQDNNHA
jgi:type VI secretion system protein ImpK